MTEKNAAYLTELHKLVNEYFNLAEIQDLCFQLNVDYESVAGDEKPSRIRGLLLGLGRNGRLPELIALVQKLRPSVNWPLVPDDIQLLTSLSFSKTTVPVNQYHYYGDVVQGDKIEGDKVAGHKIQAHTYIEKQIIVQDYEIIDLEQLPPENGEPPYKGLIYFTEADADWFFGREAATAVLINRLHDLNFLAVVGASGSGKSSLVRAGIIPVIKRNKTLVDGTIPPLGEWQVKTMPPTARPLAKLADTLFPQDQAMLQEEALERPDALQAKLASQPQSTGHKLLLFVDQFEELFTHCKDEREREAFITNLLTAANESCKIIITLRADFYTQCLHYEGLRQILKKAQEPIGAMTSHELLDAILEPAAKGNWQFQLGLVEEMLDDVGQEPGALPLLSHALLETWQRRRGRVLTLSGYREAGKVQGAIAQTAEMTYTALAAAEQTIAKRIFLRLTELGEETQDTRRRVTQTELGNDTAVRAVIQRLADARLITSTQDGADVAHEALIREWPRLREWLDADREGLIIHRRLTNMAVAWQEKEEDPSFLYTGLRLTEAEQWAKNNVVVLNDQERTFLETSLQVEKQRQRIRRSLQVGGAVILAIFIMLGIGTILINDQRNEAITARETAVASQATADINASAANFARGTAEVGATSESQARGTAVAAQGTAQFDAIRANYAEATAVNAQSQTETQRQIMALLAESQSLMSNKPSTNLEIARARLMAVAAGQIEAAGSAKNRAVIDAWQRHLATDWPAYQPIKTFHEPIDWVRNMAWSGDGNYIAATSGNLIIVWNTITWESISLTNHVYPVKSVAWSENNNYLASTSCSRYEASQGVGAFCAQGEINIWDVSSWEVVTTLTEQFGEITSVVWGNNDSFLASASCREGDEIGFCTRGEILVWDTITWQVQTILTEHTQGIRSMSWNSNKNRLVSASCQEIAFAKCIQTEFIVWNPDTWHVESKFVEHAGAVSSMSWNDNGSYLATVACGNRETNHFYCIHNEIIIWDTTTWAPITRLNEFANIFHAAWNGNGSHIAAVTSDRIIIWDTATWQAQTALIGHFSEISSIAWSKDGNRLVSASCSQYQDSCFQAEITIWDTAIRQPLKTISDMDKVARVLWNNDGSYLASISCGDKEVTDTCTQDEITIWDTSTWQIRAVLTDHSGDILDIAWNKDNTLFASAGSDELVIVWDTNSWEPIKRLIGHSSKVTSISWNSHLDYFASASCMGGAEEVCSQGEIIIWDSTNWNPITKLVDNSAEVTSIAWSNDGSRLASASCIAFYADCQGEIIIWNVVDWVPIKILQGFVSSRTPDSPSGVGNVSWSRESNQLAAILCEPYHTPCQGKVVIWDTQSWVQIADLSEKGQHALSVAWNWEANSFAMASCVQTSYAGGSIGPICVQENLTIWGITTWELITRITEHSGIVLSLDWDENSDRLATVSCEGVDNCVQRSIMIWEGVGGAGWGNCNLANNQISIAEWENITSEIPYPCK